MTKSLVAFALLVMTGPALACSLDTDVKRFKPDASHFVPKFDEDHVALLPAPDVKVLDVRRGTGSDGFSCSDAGSISVRIAWPESSKYGLDEIGFYFRVSSGRTPDMIFPLAPVTGIVKGDSTEFSFVWLDGAPSDQSPLNIEVEVFAVNNGNEIGAPARFHVRAPPAPPLRTKIGAGHKEGKIEGLAMPGALVVIDNPKTGLHREVTANAQGEYRFDSLPDGAYVITTNGIHHTVLVLGPDGSL